MLHAPARQRPLMRNRLLAAVARGLLASAGAERGLFREARRLTDRAFGRRIRLFAPMYVSDFCVNSCLYCGFRREHRFQRRALLPDGVTGQALALLAAGHRTGLLVAGEHRASAGPVAIARAVAAARAAGLEDVPVEVMPMTVAGYRSVREAGAAAVLLYQETYDRNVYRIAHPRGPKASYEWRRYALARALGAGFRRVGVGILLGLADPVWDAAQLILHARELHRHWGIWPTVSLPRLQPAGSAPWAARPPAPVRLRAFLRLVALVRVALPECGIICSTREPVAVRRLLLELGIGITHVSAGVSTRVGGYTEPAGPGQFAIQDERSAAEVAAELRALGYEPRWSDTEAAEVTA
jgi:2-iminoacetate synthase